MARGGRGGEGRGGEGEGEGGEGRGGEGGREGEGKEGRGGEGKGGGGGREGEGEGRGRRQWERRTGDKAGVYKDHTLQRSEVTPQWATVKGIHWSLDVHTHAH